MIFHFGTFSIDVNVEQTRKYYTESPRTLTEGCDCIGCQNFMKACEDFDPRIREFFEALGVDIRKAPDMSVFHGDGKRNILFYMGWYHLCGTVLRGENAWVSDSPEIGHWEKTMAYPVTDGCCVSFSDSCALVDKAFPRPVIQMDVDIQVPWVIENIRHEYLK